MVDSVVFDKVCLGGCRLLVSFRVTSQPSLLMKLQGFMTIKFLLEDPSSGR